MKKKIKYLAIFSINFYFFCYQATDGSTWCHKLTIFFDGNWCGYDREKISKKIYYYFVFQLCNAIYFIFPVNENKYSKI